MTSPQPTGATPVDELSTVTVAVFGQRAPSPEALHDALTALSNVPVAWSAASGPELPTSATVDIVVCDAELIADFVGRWPAASTLALVPSYDDGTAVVRTIDAGANVCVRAGDTALIAAFVQATARRRVLMEKPGPR